jgi:hypothetical protein
MSFGGVVADPDNHIPMERARGGGARRLQRVAHGTAATAAAVPLSGFETSPGPAN